MQPVDVAPQRAGFVISRSSVRLRSPAPFNQEVARDFLYGAVFYSGSCFSISPNHLVRNQVVGSSILSGRAIFMSLLITLCVWLSHKTEVISQIGPSWRRELRIRHVQAILPTQNSTEAIFFFDRFLDIQTERHPKKGWKKSPALLSRTVLSYPSATRLIFNHPCE